MERKNFLLPDVNRITWKSKPENSLGKKMYISMSLINMAPNFLNK